jgi:peptidoglycan/xylan/chitin deacetylase (PgdA/CDA1 family)
MPVSRRQLLQMAALGAVAAGCSSTDNGLPTARVTAPTPSAPGPSSPSDTTSSDTTTSDTTAGATTTSPTAAPSVRRPKITSAPELGHGKRSVPSVALTFHGAGDPAIARAVLHELEREHVRATVLAVGTWLEAEPAMAGRVLGAGHELGNHTLHHLPMLGLDAATSYAEIVGCARTLHRLTGSQGRWFRASGTQHTNPIIRTAAARAGYAQCLSYDLDSLDWTDPGPAAIVRAVLAGARGGSIVSLHLGHRGTVAAMPAVLSGLQTLGLKPTTVGELVG